jgi:hypothetical protein
MSNNDGPPPTQLACVSTEMEVKLVAVAGGMLTERSDVPPC